MKPKHRILIGAHRGAMCYEPENTLAAFEKAIELGTYRIELDVRLSADGHVVVMHDATVDRTTDGSGRVDEMTLAELKKLRVGGKEPVPTLTETLRCVGRRCLLLVEIKPPGIADAVVDVIRAEGMVQQCTISSFDEPTLLRVKELEPDLPTAYFLIEPKPFDAAEVVRRLGASMLIGWRRAMSAAIMADAHQAGMHVRCGFGDQMGYEETYALFRELADMGADEISCGRPDWIARMIEQYELGGVAFGSGAS
jgi:glycerophosphoryl diester phosphodiesterase